MLNSGRDTAAERLFQSGLWGKDIWTTLNAFRLPHHQLWWWLAGCSDR